jgi:hypothetical protein
MSNTSEHNIAISYYIDEENSNEEENNNNEFDINNFLEGIEVDSLDDDLTLSKILNYNDNCTVKDLLLICEFYGIAKQFKNGKFKKEEIINFLVYFESNPINNDIVNKRQTMWFYIGQLKNDKFMKKYVLW